MKVQFVSKRAPDGRPLHEAEAVAVPRPKDWVTVPGYRETVVDRVVWVYGADGGEPSVVVVLG
jgi:hypothetical protein